MEILTALVVRNSLRRLMLSAATALALVLFMGLSATPASATASFLNCQGTSTVTYSPGLTHTPQSVTVTSNNTFPTCTSSDGSITSAYLDTSVHTGVRSCTSLLNSGSGPLTIRYNNGQSTTYTSNFSATYLLGQLSVTDTGPVTSGQFTGGTAAGQAVYLADLSKCGTPEGITSLSGPYTVSIVGL